MKLEERSAREPSQGERLRLGAAFSLLSLTLGCASEPLGKEASRKPEPELLATWSDSAGFWSSRDLVVSGGEVFWHDIVEVRRVAVSGGELSSILKNGCGPMYGFAVDERDVYAGTCSEDASVLTLAAISRSSGQRRVLAEGGALDVALGGDSVYFVSCNPTVSRLTDGELSFLPFLGAEACPYRIMLSGTRLAIEELGGVSSFDLATNEPAAFGSARLLWTDSERIFIARADASGEREALLAVAPDGSEQLLRSPEQAGHFGGVVSRGNTIYYSWVANDRGHLQRLELPSLEPETLVDASTALGSIALDAGHIYWEAFTDETHAQLFRQQL